MKYLPILLIYEQLSLFLVFIFPNSNQTESFFNGKIFFTTPCLRPTGAGKPAKGHEEKYKIKENLRGLTLLRLFVAILKNSVNLCLKNLDSLSTP